MEISVPTLAFVAIPPVSDGPGGACGLPPLAAPWKAVVVGEAAAAPMANYSYLFDAGSNLKVANVC